MQVRVYLSLAAHDQDDARFWAALPVEERVLQAWKIERAHRRLRGEFPDDQDFLDLLRAFIDGNVRFLIVAPTHWPAREAAGDGRLGRVGGCHAGECREGHVGARAVCAPTAQVRAEISADPASSSRWAYRRCGLTSDRTLGPDVQRGLVHSNASGLWAGHGGCHWSEAFIRTSEPQAGRETSAMLRHWRVSLHSARGRRRR